MTPEEVSLRDHVEHRIEEMDRRIYQAIDSRDKALRVAVDELNARLELLNELRGNVATKADLENVTAQLLDLSQRLEAQGNSYVSEQTYATRHQEIERRMTEVDQWRSNLTGRIVGFATVGGLFVAMVSGLAVKLFG